MSSASEEGLQMRRAVLGAEYVERAYATSTEFSRDLQPYLVDHCWGNVWVRPGLAPRLRSIVTLSVLATNGHWHEFQSHVRGALQNGLTAEELREIFLQVGVYAGAPVAVAAFRAAEDTVREWESETPD